MASLVAETQLEKDVASNAGVIPIYPWFKDGKPKDGLLPNIYANMLLQEKRANGQEGIIKRCDHDGCENDYKAMFWRSADTPENIVPEGWTDFGGSHHFTECPNCRARDIRDIGLDEFMEDGRVDINLKHGSTGSSDTNDKPLRPLTVSLPRPTINNTERRTNMLLNESELKKEARKLFKKRPDHLRVVLKQIDEDESKKRANAAEDRKRKNADAEYFKFIGQNKKSKKTGGKRRRKKRTRRRRKSRGKSRRKSRGKSRRKKKHRKKRTRRRK